MVIKQDIRPNKMIWVTFNKEGMHKYPAALTDPALATGDKDLGEELAKIITIESLR